MHLEDNKMGAPYFTIITFSNLQRAKRKIPLIFILFPEEKRTK
jgi:hypothetical protein